MITSEPAKRCRQLIVLAILVSAQSSAVLASAYSVLSIELPRNHGYVAIPTSINDTGVVAVWAAGRNADVPSRAFLWQADETMEIPTPHSQNTTVYGINNSGHAVGFAYDADGLPHGFLWDPRHGLLDPSTPELPHSYLRAINNHVQLGGQAAPSTVDVWGAITWNLSAGTIVLPPLGSGNSGVNAINDAGQAVGTSGNDPERGAYPVDPNAPYGYSHAVLWEQGTVVDLTAAQRWSEAFDINNLGQVVGTYMHPTASQTGGLILTERPFLWEDSRGLIELPLLRDEATAIAINDVSEAVGSARFFGTNESIAVLWQDDAIHDLNTFLPANSGWFLENATSINNLGQIVGTGTYLGQPAAFLLTPTTPIPEPTILLPLAALLPLARRRHHR